jgi:hypothetical protein
MTLHGEARRPIYGWTTCLTYEAGPKPLGPEHFLSLLGDMRRNGMTRVIVMMTADGYFDPLHHGLAWPVSRKPLEGMVDPGALNADPKTEFFGRFIDAAHERGIEVFIELKYLGHDGVEEAYPGIEFLRDAQGRRVVRAPDGSTELARRRIDTLQVCCDSEPAQRFMRDKMEDVLGRYPKLDGMVLEHPSYGRGACYCPASKRRLLGDLGKPMEQSSAEELTRWKNARIRDTLIAVRSQARAVIPALKLGFYTGFSPHDGDVRGFQEARGHAVETIGEAGWDFLMPYGEGRHAERETAELERVIAYLAPQPVYLHTVVRRVSPHNYQLPVKDPACVRNIVAWGKAMALREPRFLGMSFFNEVKVPHDNREAVYQGTAAS